MKTSIRPLLILPFSLVLICFTLSCEKKGPGEEIGKTIDDATDSRPNEGIKDAIENADEAIKDAVN